MVITTTQPSALITGCWLLPLRTFGFGWVSSVSDPLARSASQMLLVRPSSVAGALVKTTNWPFPDTVGSELTAGLSTENGTVVAAVRASTRVGTAGEQMPAAMTTITPLRRAHRRTCCPFAMSVFVRLPSPGLVGRPRGRPRSLVAISELGQ